MRLFNFSLAQVKNDWFTNIRGDPLAGLVVALALIPEAIAFSIIAGVDPKVGLYASFSIAVITAFTGGRPGMISAVTAATAVLMVTLVKTHGLQYLLATTVLAGVSGSCWHAASGHLDEVCVKVSFNRFCKCASNTNLLCPNP